MDHRVKGWSQGTRSRETVPVYRMKRSAKIARTTRRVHATAAAATELFRGGPGFSCDTLGGTRNWMSGYGTTADSLASARGIPCKAKIEREQGNQRLRENREENTRQVPVRPQPMPARVHGGGGARHPSPFSSTICLMQNLHEMSVSATWVWAVMSGMR